MLSLCQPVLMLIDQQKIPSRAMVGGASHMCGLCSRKIWQPLPTCHFVGQHWLEGRGKHASVRSEALPAMLRCLLQGPAEYCQLVPYMPRNCQQYCQTPNDLGCKAIVMSRLFAAQESRPHLIQALFPSWHLSLAKRTSWLITPSQAIRLFASCFILRSFIPMIRMIKS